MNCSGPSGDPIDAYVRSPRSAAPPVAFVFGRLPQESNVVRATVASRHLTTGKVFVITPRGLRLPYRLFVAHIEGYEYPWVPDAIVQAVDTADNRVIASGPTEHPTWARAPFTVIERVASGIREFHPFEDEAPGPWEIDVFRDEQTGEVCLGEPGRESACGTPDDPVGAWLSTWSSFEMVTEEIGPMGFGDSVGFAWGVYRDPVASVEVEVRNDGDKSGEWTPVDPEIHELSNAYGNAFSIFVVECACWELRVHTFAADGSEIGLDRLS